MPLTEGQLEIMAEADQLCATDPVQAAVRDELIRMDEFLAPYGYNVRDINNFSLFQFNLSPDTGQLHVAVLDTLSTVCAYFAQTMNSPWHVIVDMVTSLLINPELSPVSLPEMTRTAIRTALHEQAPQPGWEFYGVGISGQALSVGMDDPAAAEIVAGNLEHEAVRPLRYMHLLARDSRIWTLYHQEGLDRIYGTGSADEPAHSVPELDALVRLSMALTDA